MSQWIINHPEMTSTLAALGVVLSILLFYAVAIILARTTEHESKERKNWRLNTGGHGHE